MLIVKTIQREIFCNKHFLLKMHYWRVPEILNYRKSGRNILSNVKPLGHKMITKTIFSKLFIEIDKNTNLSN